ncbi:MAG TPA: S-methylmethionine permease [Lentisphaeria bacterium]|nr:MAG: amino acid permease [Lentisphaerae bacterium GWF2_38_69]HBM17407.1 S-methylmethionine permease [Lentisphaeria bacterium]
MAEEDVSKYYDEKEEALTRGMKTRHLTMIAIGGAIGSGLFIGAGDVLTTAGPLGAVIGYIVGGMIMYAAMLSLGEMAVAMPISGSFQAYASKFISPMAGYATGWLYWLNWGTSGAAALVASAMIMHAWFPMVQDWVWCLVFSGGLTLLNLLPVGNFGEAEFWFAGIKVAAILCFIVVGVMIIFGFVPHQAGTLAGFKTFYADGWFPNGLTSVFLAMVTVSVAFQGTELVGIAAGESKNPERNVPRAIKQVGFRIFLFYILSTIVLAMIIPYKEAGLSQSPFAQIFSFANIPYAYNIMNFVIITACLSLINSSLYACSRLLWSMSHEGLAPKFLGKTNRHMVPIYGVFITLALMLMALLIKFFGAEKIILMIMNASGLIGCLIWAMIGAAHLGFRRYYVKHGGDPDKLKFRVILHPVIPIFCLAANLIIVFSMYFDPTQRTVFYSGVACVVVIILTYLFFVKGRKTDFHLNR